MEQKPKSKLIFLIIPIALVLIAGAVFGEHAASSKSAASRTDRRMICADFFMISPSQVQEGGQSSPSPFGFICFSY